MSLISKHKDKLIAFLKFFNTKPGFQRVFYHIHKLREDVLTTDRFLAVELDEGFYIGTYKYHQHRMWRQLTEGSFESEETKIVKKLISDVTCFVDIGAHIGYYTCLAHHLSPQISILSFEPNPENFISLKKNIELNSAVNCRAFNIGLGEKKETAILYGVDAMGSIVKETYDTHHLPHEQISVHIEKLDSFIDKVPTNAKVLIKMDVEGNELNVLRGSWEFIRKCQPVGLMIEICKRWSTQDNPFYEETFTVLKRNGYVAYSIGEIPGVLITKVDNPVDYNSGNFLFIRKNMTNDFEKKLF